MAGGALYEIEYAWQVKRHLAAIDRKHWPLIRDHIADQLSYEPDLETRNRKPLINDMFGLSEWELRCGPDNRFRVFYDVDAVARKVVVLAVGVKRRERLWIGGVEVTG